MRAVFEKIHPFFLKGWHYRGFRAWLPAFHPHVEMIYVVKGAVMTVVDGVEHLLRAGELSVVFPYVPHSYESAPEAEALVLIVAPEVLAFEDILRKKLPARHYADGRAWYPLIARAVELSAAGKQELAQCYANAALGEFLEQAALKDADGGDSDTAVQILQYCSDHFAGDITLQKVSAALFVSPGYVSKIFARKFKYRFRDYINALRIRKARELLADTSVKMPEVMYACGFKNQSSFNRVFLEICGVTPSCYRQKTAVKKPRQS